MKKLYVIVNHDGRTDDQIADVREAIRSAVEEGLMEDITLLLPTDGIDGVAADVDAITKADIVVSTQGSMYNRDCRVCNFVASEYVSYGVYEEDWVELIVYQRREEREREIADEIARASEEEDVEGEEDETVSS